MTQSPGCTESPIGWLAGLIVYRLASPIFLNNLKSTEVCNQASPIHSVWKRFNKPWVFHSIPLRCSIPSIILCQITGSQARLLLKELTLLSSGCNNGGIAQWQGYAGTPQVPWLVSGYNWIAQCPGYAGTPQVPWLVSGYNWIAQCQGYAGTPQAPWPVSGYNWIAQWWKYWGCNREKCGSNPGYGGPQFLVWAPHIYLSSDHSNKPRLRRSAEWDGPRPK